MYTDEPSDEFQRGGVGEKKNSKLEGIVVVDFFFFLYFKNGRRNLSRRISNEDRLQSEAAGRIYLSRFSRKSGGHLNFKC